MFESYQHGIHGRRREVKVPLKVHMARCDAGRVSHRVLANEGKELALLSSWPFARRMCCCFVSRTSGLNHLQRLADSFNGSFNLLYHVPRSLRDEGFVFEQLA